MARNDYYAIQTPTLTATSQAIRDVNQTAGDIAPEDYPDLISAMHSAADYNNVMDQLVEETVSGPIASFTDGANNIPVKELICTINPTETGTGAKSPSNPYVIGGHTGINVTQTGKNQYTGDLSHTGVINDSGTTGTANSRLYTSPTKVLPNTSYAINLVGEKSGETIYINRVVEYDANGVFIRRQVTGSTLPYIYSNPSDCCYIVLDLRTSSLLDIESTDVSDIQIEFGTTATSYEPYITPTTHTADFGQTVYGGEFVASEGEYDKVVPTWKSVTPRPTDAFIDSSGGMNGIYFYNVLDRNYNFIEGACAVADINTSTPVASGNMRIGAGNAHIYWYGIMDELGFTTREEFRTWLTNNPVTIYYKSTVAQDPIILPTKTQVNTLLGANNIYHDCNGNTEVTYRANGGLYVAQH